MFYYSIHKRYYSDEWYILKRNKPVTSSEYLRPDGSLGIHTDYFLSFIEVIYLLFSTVNNIMQISINDPNIIFNDSQCQYIYQSMK